MHALKMLYLQIARNHRYVDIPVADRDNRNGVHIIDDAPSRARSRNADSLGASFVPGESDTVDQAAYLRHRRLPCG